MSAAVARLRAAVAGWFAEPNPILVKELRSTFRTALFVRFLYLSTAFTALIVLAVGAAMASGDQPPAAVGQVVFQLFFSVALFVLCVVSPGYASAAITSEREQETWESLELSGMSPWRVVLGKLAGPFASVSVVLVAFSPVVGIAFLFGGVSPWQVLVGFASLLLALLVASTFGIAISARLSSTRLSIVISTALFVPLSFMAVMTLGGLGDVARREWGLSMGGPFFFTEAFATRAGEWDTWALLVGVPLFAIGMPVWFLLASAVAGIRPAAENRVRPLKTWAAAMTLLSAAAGAALLWVVPHNDDRGEAALVVMVGCGFLLVFYGLLFSNERALPPRPWRRRMQAAPPHRRWMGLFGPGAAGTLRFALLAVAVSAFMFAATLIGARYLRDPSYARHLRYDAAIVVLAVGSWAVGSFTASLGAWLRMTLRHGLAARVLTLAVLAGTAVLPFLVALLIEPDGLSDLDDAAPLMVFFSNLYPGILAAQIEDGNVEAWRVASIAFTAGAYGLPALALWIVVEVKAWRAGQREARRRARFEGEGARSACGAGPSGDGARGGSEAGAATPACAGTEAGSWTGSGSSGSGSSASGSSASGSSASGSSASGPSASGPSVSGSTGAGAGTGTGASGAGEGDREPRGGPG